MTHSAIRITSVNNARVKEVVRLNNRRYRDERQLTVVEGEREALLALHAGVVPVAIFLCRDFLSGSASAVLAEERFLDQAQLFEVTPDVFAKMAYRGRSGGILLVIPYFKRTLADLAKANASFVVVVDGAEKPGNLGAILRTADAAGVDGLIVTSAEADSTDIHNPNVIRASLGAIFTVPVVSASFTEARSWLHDQKMKIIATSPDAEVPYTSTAMTGPVAIVLGSEAHGLGDSWLEAADSRVRIPMFGQVDSLNLSVSAALLLYEVVRQRGPNAADVSQMP